MSKYQFAKSTLWKIGRKHWVKLIVLFGWFVWVWLAHTNPMTIDAIGFIAPLSLPRDVNIYFIIDQTIAYVCCIGCLFAIVQIVKTIAQWFKRPIINDKNVNNEKFKKRLVIVGLFIALIVYVVFFVKAYESDHQSYIFGRPLGFSFDIDFVLSNSFFLALITCCFWLYKFIKFIKRICCRGIQIYQQIICLCSRWIGTPKLLLHPSNNKEE